MTCDIIGGGYAYFTVTFPGTATQAIKRLCVPENGEFINIDFSTVSQPNGIPVGASAIETATLFANAINTGTVPTVVSARNYYELSATRYNNIVTVKLRIPPHQCGEQVRIRGYTEGASALECGEGTLTPYVNDYQNSASALQCCEPDITCNDIGIGRQGVKIVFPTNIGGTIWRLRIGELIGDPEQLLYGQLGGPACLEWDFLDMAAYQEPALIPDVPNGEDGYETAQSVYDTIRYFSIQDILLSVGGQISVNLNEVIISWDISLLNCCSDSLSVAINDGGAGTLYAYSFGKACCENQNDFSEPDCSDYPENSYIERVRFIDNGQGFGPGPNVNKRRYKILIGSYTGTNIHITQWFSDARAFDAVVYSDFEEWILGFANYYNNYGAGWFHEVNYLGGGVIEFVVDTENSEVQSSDWLSEGAAGIRLQVEGVSYLGSGESIPGTEYPYLSFERISRTWCNQDNPPVIIDPPIIINPPPLVIFPQIDINTKYNPPAEHDIINFDCCAYTVGGIRRILIQDYTYFLRAFWNQNGVVTSILTLSDAWQELCIKNNSCVFDIKEERSNDGIRFSIKISASTLFANEINRLAVTYLIRRKIICIVEDSNGRYWLIGNDGGLSIDNINHNSGRVGGDSHAYTFEFVGFSRYLPRMAAESVGGSLQIGSNCSNFIDIESGPVYVNVFGNCFISELGNNYFDNP